MSLDGSRSRSAIGYDSPLRTRNSDISLSAYSQAGKLSYCVRTCHLLFWTELQVLRDIISISTDVDDGTSFLAVFKAYDSVLKSRNIDPATDRVYFKFLLKLARVQGATWMQKFDNILRVRPYHICYSRDLGTRCKWTKLTNPFFSYLTHSAKTTSSITTFAHLKRHRHPSCWPSIGFGITTTVSDRAKPSSKTLLYRSDISYRSGLFNHLRR